MSDAPLLEAKDCRIAIDGVTAIDRLSFASKGDRVLLCGDARALMAALTGVPVAAREHGVDSEEESGDAIITSGALAIDGKSVAEGAHLPIVGAAPLDPPMPPKWTALDYVAWGARLGGGSARASKSLAMNALARVGMERAAKQATSTLALAEKRALVIAQAAVLGPPILILEAPLAGLDGAAAAFVLRAIAQATKDGRAILSTVKLDPTTAEGVIAREASYVAVVAGGELVVEGTPNDLFASARLYAITVRANAADLRRLLAQRGIDLKGGPRRFAAALPEGVSTRDLLAASRAARAPIVEMVPIFEAPRPP